MPACPGLALLLTVVSMHVVEEGLTDALHPQANRARAGTASEQSPHGAFQLVQGERRIPGSDTMLAKDHCG